jgi:hypothetical protein
MGTATVRKLESDEIAAEREAILEALRMTEDQLRERAESYLLTEEESVLWRRLEALTWLAGE